MIKYVFIILFSCKVFAQPLNGNITVGTGGDYTTFTGNTGLFKAINDNGLDGNVSVSIISDITELATVSLNQWGEFPSNSNYTLTIKSNDTSVKTILSNAGNHVFRINGADRVIIDGSVNGNGTYLNFVGWTQSVFFFSNGATNNQLKNLKISCRYATSGSVIFAASNNSNNLVENCEIFNRPAGTNYPKHGIHSYNITNVDNVFRNNIIYGFFEAGIYIESGDNVLIEGNEIYSDVGVYGIWFRNITRIDILKNRIYNNNTAGLRDGIRFSYNGTFTGTGIITNISNNMISLNPNVPSNIDGISLDSNNSEPVTVNLYHNSIVISGSEDSSFSANGVEQIDIGFLNFANNIVINTRENTRVTGQPGISRCLSFTSNSGNSIVNSNNNLLFSSGTNTWIGQWNATLTASLSDWQTISSLDSNSISKNVNFISETDLHLTGTSVGDADLAVTALASVDDDFDFETRVPTTYMGCDEVPNTLSVEGSIVETLHLYPNPIQDYLNIKIQNSENYNIKIFDLSGKLLNTYKDQSRINCQHLEPGIYVLSLESSEKSMIRKFIKK